MNLTLDLINDAPEEKLRIVLVMFEVVIKCSCHAGLNTTCKASDSREFSPNRKYIRAQIGASSIRRKRHAFVTIVRLQSSVEKEMKRGSSKEC